MTGVLAGKVLAVTGAGGGLGRDFALGLSALGASIVVNDLGTSLDGAGSSATAAHRVVDEITASGGEAVANTESVATADGAQSIVDAAIATFGRIDGVINNAGITRDRIFFKMSEDEWLSVLDTHLNGTYFVSRAVAPVLRAQRSGSIVNITSTSALIGNLGQANYSAAKLGIVGLTRAIALDMKRDGVRANAIAPFAWTRMTDSIRSSPDQEARIAKLRQMTGTQVVPLAAYLLSDRSEQISGQVFVSRRNEIFLMSLPRPVRSVHEAGGWTVESISTHAMPALETGFFPLVSSSDVFSWDPI